MKKAIALLVMLSIITSLVSCSLKKERQAEVDSEPVIETTKKIADALKRCDIDDLEKYCDDNTEDIKKAMPYVDVDSKTSEKTFIKKAIASTLEYEIDEDSFESSKRGQKCSLDVEFTYKDYNEIIDEDFFDIEAFKSRLNGVSETVDIKVTLKFEEDDDNFILVNSDELTELYEYKGANIKIMDDMFDMVENIYMTGDNWDPDTESYYNTNTFEMVLEISEEGQNYDWEYAYKVALETADDWPTLEMSQFTVVEGPEEIRIIYTQDEIIPEGFYCILVYNTHDSAVIGMEFDVYETEK